MARSPKTTMFLAVTADEYELPTYYADNLKDLARMMRRPYGQIAQARAKGRTLQRDRLKIIRVDFQD